MTSAADDDLEDWDDNFELKPATKKPQQTNSVNMGAREKPGKTKKQDDEDNDPLSFLKKADEERKAIANRK